MVHQRAEKAPVPDSETHMVDLNPLEPIGTPLPELVGANDDSAHTNSGPVLTHLGCFSLPDYLAGSDRFPTSYRRGPPPSPVSQITMSGRGSRGPCGSQTAASKSNHQASNKFARMWAWYVTYPAASKPKW
ncbi:hypothetical protein BWQ96_02377 [Gracilariopsis chorda]|uniref:Uncharacterized protein n=1 Tax=Gracilariopsis chorda TaxID=448386 RepID=A0A2V3J0B8_9FLOR|nr:hypothetical protein BWQ96_02377 [Gracilariopsis chorda]|eukprot:PXF47841.1 hypothetical protein BWQ96_02377 [Gracilariopsis chorda]